MGSIHRGQKEKQPVQHKESRQVKKASKNRVMPYCGTSNWVDITSEDSCKSERKFSGQAGRIRRQQCSSSAKSGNQQAGHREPGGVQNKKYAFLADSKTETITSSEVMLPMSECSETSVRNINHEGMKLPRPLPPPMPTPKKRNKCCAVI